LTEKLVKIATWRDTVNNKSNLENNRVKVAHVRFGRTELQMPIITCGGKSAKLVLYEVVYKSNLHA
jgi:hypothetical protein